MSKNRYDFIDYLKFSENIINNDMPDLEETKYRVIISRAYYAAYHYAEIFVNNLPSPPPSPEKGLKHVRIVKYLKETPEYTDYGMKLSQLKDYREESDYHDYKHITKEKAFISLQLSKEVIEYLKKIS